MSYLANHGKDNATLYSSLYPSQCLVHFLTELQASFLFQEFGSFLQLLTPVILLTNLNVLFRNFYFLSRLNSLAIPNSYFCKHGRRRKWEEHTFGGGNTATGSCSHIYNNEEFAATTEKKNTESTDNFTLGKNVLRNIFLFLKNKACCNIF